MCIYTHILSFLASGSEDKHVRVWDVDAQDCIQTLIGHTAEVRKMKKKLVCLCKIKNCFNTHFPNTKYNNTKYNNKMLLILKTGLFMHL
jgi:WD40 repeat protein